MSGGQVLSSDEGSQASLPPHPRRKGTSGASPLPSRWCWLPQSLLLMKTWRWSTASLDLPILPSNSTLLPLSKSGPQLQQPPCPAASSSHIPFAQRLMAVDGSPADLSDAIQTGAPTELKAGAQSFTFVPDPSGSQTDPATAASSAFRQQQQTATVIAAEHAAAATVLATTAQLDPHSPASAAAAAIALARTCTDAVQREQQETRNQAAAASSSSSSSSCVPSHAAPRPDSHGEGRPQPSNQLHHSQSEAASRCQQHQGLQSQPTPEHRSQGQEYQEQEPQPPGHSPQAPQTPGKHVGHLRRGRRGGSPELRARSASLTTEGAPADPRPVQRPS